MLDNWRFRILLAVYACGLGRFTCPHAKHSWTAVSLQLTCLCFIDVQDYPLILLWKDNLHLPLQFFSLFLFFFHNFYSSKDKWNFFHIMIRLIILNAWTRFTKVQIKYMPKSINTNLTARCTVHARITLLFFFFFLIVLVFQSDVPRQPFCFNTCHLFFFSCVAGRRL